MSATTDPAVTVADRGHDHCLLCGGANPRSLRLAFATGRDGVTRASLRGHPHLQGYDGILHGGVVAALLDATMTHRLFAAGIRAVTAELTVRYVESVDCDHTLALSAWITARSRRLYRLRAELSSEGSVRAWAEAKFLRLQI